MTVQQSEKPSKMVEKVARALCDDTLKRWRTPIGVKSEPWREFIPAARAAIQAMRDVRYQFGVLEAGQTAVNLEDEGETPMYLGLDEVEEIWGKMIDAALSEESAP